jgi:DNA/RNA-binding domain of Phe-tRNA-synthetase-like protein
MVEVKLHGVPRSFVAGFVQAVEIQPAPSTAGFLKAAQQTVDRLRSNGLAGGESRRTAIRDLLRQGGYRPAGRNKPAQEYLWRTIQQQAALPQILNLVDLVNLKSLQSGLPISLVGLERLGWRLEIRLGRPGERYVFNHGGQELELNGLLCLCRLSSEGSQPGGSPVKDSMWGKVTTEDRTALACVYASEQAIHRPELQRWLEELAEGFRRECNARETRTWVQSA